MLSEKYGKFEFSSFSKSAVYPLAPRNAVHHIKCKLNGNKVITMAEERAIRLPNIRTNESNREEGSFEEKIGRKGLEDVLSCTRCWKEVDEDER